MTSSLLIISIVDEPETPARLLGSKRLLSKIYLFKRSLIILTKVFLKQSSKVIGLVLLRLPSNSLGLGVGKIVAFRQRSGTVFNFKMRLNSCIIRCNTFNG